MASDRASQELGHRLAMGLRAAYSHLRRSTNLAFASTGMTSDQYVLLAVLERDGDATQQELVRRCYSDTATIGAMVALLTSKGLIARVAHPHDGRAWAVKLTEAGLGLAAEMHLKSAELRTKIVRLFERNELESLIESLDRIATEMTPPPRRAKASKASPGRSARRAVGHSRRDRNPK